MLYAAFRQPSCISRAARLIAVLGLAGMMAACGSNTGGDLSRGPSQDDDFWAGSRAPAPAPQAEGSPTSLEGITPRAQSTDAGRRDTPWNYYPGPARQPEGNPDQTGNIYGDLARNDRGANPYQGGAYNQGGASDWAMGGDVVVPYSAGRGKVAILLPLSGPHKAIGQALYRAAQMALFSIPNSDITLLPKDTQGDPATAAQKAREAINEGASLVIGPLFASSVDAVAPITSSARVAVIAFSNDRNVARPGVYLMGFLPEQQVTRVIRFSHRSGLRRFAALFPDTTYGRRVSNAFYASVQGMGSDVVVTSTYPPDAEKMFAPVRYVANFEARSGALQTERAELEARNDPFSKAALERLKNRETLGGVPFDAVLLPEGGQLLRALAPLLPYYDVDPKEVKFLGTGLWAEDKIGREPSLVGGWFAGPTPGASDAFKAHYQKLYKQAPPTLATMGFDAVALAVALSRSPSSDPFAPREITRPEGFAGLDGIFRFHRDGLNERGLAVIEVKANGFAVLDPAPARFDAADAIWQRDTVEDRNRTGFGAYSTGQ